MSEHNFLISEWQVRLRFVNEDEKTGMHLLPSFEPFVLPSTEKSNAEMLFEMTVDQSLESFSENDTQHVKVCDTGTGRIAVDRLLTGGYQFEIRDLSDVACALLIAEPDFQHCRCRILCDNTHSRAYGLNNAMMLAFAFAGASRGTLLIHASLVRHAGTAYAFIAKSGTGKSTQTANWLKMIEGCDLMNDDNPIVRVIGDNVWIYGSPWSGKTPCYRQVKAPLGAVSRIVRDQVNHVVRIDPFQSLSDLLSSCSVMPWDKPTYRGICNTVTAVIEHTPIYHLHCTAAPESALVCYDAIGKTAAQS